MRPHAFFSAFLVLPLLATPLIARADEGAAADERRGWFFGVSALLVGGGGSLKLHPSSVYGEPSGSSPEKTVEPFLGPGVELAVGHAVVPNLALALDGTLFAGAVTSDSPNFVPNPHTSGVQGERVLVTAEWFALPHLGFRLGAGVESMTFSTPDAPAFQYGNCAGCPPLVVDFRQAVRATGPAFLAGVVVALGSPGKVAFSLAADLGVAVLDSDVESYLPVTGTLRVGMTYF
jgi:hypothetical protein